MGPTGSGKSNFIDKLIKHSTKFSGDQLQSYTKDVHAVRVQGHKSYGDRIVLVDTPGFDDTNRSDMEILEMIGTWLKKTYEHKILLAGILYFHRITDNRMSGTPHRNLRMFGQLCGDKAAHKVVLVTTMWDRVQEHLGNMREEELRNVYWSKMLASGSTDIVRFDNGLETAWNIVNTVLELHEKRPETEGRNQREDIQKEALLLQEEMVVLKRRLNETKAGVTLYTVLQKLLVEQKATLRQLADKAEGDPKLAGMLEAEYKRVEEELEDTFKSINKLKISIPRKVYLFFAKNARAHSLTLE
ncbi:hypothetical protein B0H34DRAFT_415061 [Crassisporium funariophilum]|nr:hypothetical protein B0H34DRAFT_415061 [Crassisporium funariophilum]